MLLSTRFSIGWKDAFLFDQFWHVGGELVGGELVGGELVGNQLESDDLAVEDGAVRLPAPPEWSEAASVETMPKLGDGGLEQVALATTRDEIFILSGDASARFCRSRGRMPLRCDEVTLKAPMLGRQLVLGPRSPLALDPFGATWQLPAERPLVETGSLAASMGDEERYVVALRPDEARAPEGYRRGQLHVFPWRGSARTIDLRGNPFDVGLVSRWVVTIDRGETATISIEDVETYGGGVAAHRLGEVSSPGVELVASCNGPSTALVFESKDEAWIAVRRAEWSDLLPIEVGHHHLACTRRGATLTALTERRGKMEVTVTRCDKRCEAFDGIVWDPMPAVTYDVEPSIPFAPGTRDRWKDGAFDAFDAVAFRDYVLVAWLDAAAHAVRAKVAPIGSLSRARGHAILDLYDRVMPQVVHQVRVEATDDFGAVVVKSNLGTYPLRVWSNGASAPLSEKLEPRGNAR